MRILFITQTNIGDVVLSTVLLDRILASHPEATVDIVAGARAVDLFEGMANIGRLIPLVKKKRHGHYFDLWKQLRKEKYDVIVDLRASLLARFLKGKKKIVFKPNMKEHKAAQLAKLWKLPEERPLQQRLFVTDEVMQKVQKQAQGEGLVVAFAPTANWIAKQWPQKRFAELAKQLSQMKGFENARFAVFGAEHERHAVSDFLAYMPQNRVIDLVGKTSLPEAYAWLKQGSLFVGNDSGLAHMAAAADIPMVTIFGPTRDDVYAPVSYKGELVVAPMQDEVNLEPVSPKRLITDVSVEDVLQAIGKILSQEKTNEVMEDIQHAS